MKRSELKRQISEKGFAVAGYLQSGPISDTLAEEILGELEMRAGWRWDPEEEPLPERLEMCNAPATGLGFLKPHGGLPPSTAEFIAILNRKEQLP